MSSTPTHSHRRRWGCLHWLVVGFIALIGLWLAPPFLHRVAERTNGLNGSSNIRQIAIALKSYAGDHGGQYPDAATSNDALRELFRAGLVENEHIFSCNLSPYVGDDEVGTPPAFAQALQPGENHWALTKGLTDESNGNAPWIFENPAIASWPPKWDRSAAGQREPGRPLLKGGKVLIGRNDGSVSPEGLEQIEGENLATLERNNKGLNLFEAAGPHEILDIAK